MPFIHDLAGSNSDFTPETISKIDDIIERLRHKPGSLIPVLAGCQGVLGYLPVELQEYIGKRMNLPGSGILSKCVWALPVMSGGLRGYCDEFSQK
jgi:NADH:ubiquinone oxidoreductase subunit E